METEKRTTVFVSYAQDDRDHVGAVRDLAQLLTANGIDVRLDLLAAERPQDWPSWMQRQIEDADHVLVIASPAYKQRSDGAPPGGEGHGVRWETRLIRDLSYADPDVGLAKVLPVLLPGRTAGDIPTWLGPASRTRYRIADYTVHGAERLLRYLTRQPYEVMDEPGPVPVLPPRDLRGAQPGDGSAAGPAEPRYRHALPPAVDAVGREDLLGEVLRAVTSEDGRRPVTVVSGMAGVGKTTTVLAAAHRLEGRFAAVLYLDLRGYDIERAVTPELGLAQLLPQLEAGLEEENGLEPGIRWRRRLTELAAHGGHVLTVLDNVRSAADIAPFHTPEAGHRILAASRHTLTDLVGARHVEVGVLSRDHAVQLLARRLPDCDPRAGESQALAEIAELCGDLPLALDIAGGLLGLQPEKPPQSLARELNEAVSRLPVLDSGDGKAVRAALDVSYRHLSEVEAAVYRYAGLHPGAVVAPDTVAALAKQKSGPTARALLQLRRAHLLQPDGAPDSYRFHDLVRDHTRELADEHPDDRPQKARRRLYRHYVQTTAAADGQLGFQPAAGGRFGSAEDARAWLDRERPNLALVAASAVHDGRWSDACAISSCAASYLEEVHGTADALALHLAALDASVHLPAFEQAAAHMLCGNTCRAMHRYADALSHLTAAQGLASGLGRVGLDSALLHNTGLVHHRLGQYAEAERCHRQDLMLCLQNKMLRGAAQALHALSDALRGLRRPEEAEKAAENAGLVLNAIGDDQGAADAVQRTVLIALGNPGRRLSVTQLIAQQSGLLVRWVEARREESEALACLQLAALYMQACPRCGAEISLYWADRAAGIAERIDDAVISAKAATSRAVALSASADEDAAAAGRQAAELLRAAGLPEDADSIPAVLRAASADHPREYTHGHGDNAWQQLAELPHQALRADIFIAGPEYLQILHSPQHRPSQDQHGADPRAGSPGPMSSGASI